MQQKNFFVALILLVVAFAATTLSHFITRPSETEPAVTKVFPATVSSASQYLAAATEAVALAFPTKDVTWGTKDLGTLLPSWSPSTKPAPSQASGEISASPNPCTLAEGQTTCQTTISWKSSDTSYVQIWRTDQTPTQITCSQATNGSFVRNVSSVPKTFELYAASSCVDTDADRSVSLGSVTVSSVSVTATDQEPGDDEEEEVCEVGEEPLKLNGVTVACLAIGDTDVLHAQQYAYPSELPPRVVMKSAGKRVYLLSTAFTNVCRSNTNYLKQDVTFTDCNTVLKDDLTTSISANGSVIYNPSPTDLRPWERSYAGVLSAVPSGDKVIGIVHGENQNIRRGSQTYLNTVKSPVDSSCVAGYDSNGVWQNCWTQFSSFASLVWWTTSGFRNGAAPTEIGPVLWNHDTYATEGGGPYHPTLFLDAAHKNLYLYSVMNPSSGYPCLSAAKAAVDSAGLPGAFKTIAADGSFSGDALPGGFSLPLVRTFYDDTISEPACLFGAAYSGTWFSVASVAGTPYYLSLEERYLPSPATAQVVLRISDDPGDWSGSSEVILEETPGTWGVLKHTYPMFSNAFATGGEKVDADDFYVIGNQPNEGYELHALNLGLSFVE